MDQRAALSLCWAKNEKFGFVVISLTKEIVVSQLSDFELLLNLITSLWKQRREIGVKFRLAFLSARELGMIVC